MTEYLDALALFLAMVIGALGTFLVQRSKAKARLMCAGGEARKAHASASIEEAQARLSLDGATREWAERLIERFDKESEELRCELKRLRKQYDLAMDEMREKYERAMANLQAQYEGEIEELKVQIRELQTENKNLMALYVKRKP